MIKITSRFLVRIFIVFSFIVTMSSSTCQVVIGIKFIGLTAHLKKSPHPQLYPLKLDKKGIFVLNTGLVVTAEIFVYKDMVSIKAGQAIFKDCAGLFAGFSHLGFRFHGYSHNSHFSIGNGPTFFYRKNWGKLPGYIDEGLFCRQGNYQTRFFWYGGELEYIHSKKTDSGFTLSIIPGPPEFVSLTPGYSYRIR